MAAPIELPVQVRTGGAGATRALRHRGRVPAVLYGHNVAPRSLDADLHALERVWHRAGRTHLVDLRIDGEQKPRTVLIRELQVNPRTGRAQHADFLAINLREKLTAEVPVVLTGDAPAVSEHKLGSLQQLITTLRVECLPGDLPAQLNVDVSGLSEVDAGVRVSDIPVPRGVTLLQGDTDELVVKVAALRVSGEAEEAAQPQEAAAPETPEETPGAA